MKKDSKKGFTLAELMIVLTIMAVVLAIGIPTAFHYIKKAEFRKNEANAKTVYMAAETMLTYYRSSGQWETFRKDVMRKGMKNTSFGGGSDEREDRIYAVTLNRGAYGEDSRNLVCRLLDDLTYEKDMLESGAIAIEIDVETGQVYSAFYATRCKSLSYDDADSADGTVRTMQDREYSSRAKRLVGYYSVDDVANVVDLDPTRLKVTSINLINSETLSLNWSCNSRHNNLDVRFMVNFYRNGTDEKLFSTIISLADLREAGWSGNAGDIGNMAMLELADQNDAESTWSFPVTYENGTVSLVLDAMMSADVLAAQRKEGLTETERKELAASSSTSITRLAMGSSPVSPLFAAPQEIYATVQAESTYENMQGDEREYRVSAVAKSNTANTMYADGAVQQADTLTADLMTFRHLSNMRYCPEAVTAEFRLKNEKLDWDSVGVGLYRYKTVQEQSRAVQKLCWAGSSGRLAFPSIGMLPKQHTLRGLKGTKIANLRLGTESVINDTTALQLALSADSADYTKYVGLFCESEGTIQNLTFENPALLFAEGADGRKAENVKDYAHISGVGIVAGRGQGIFENISITTDRADTEILTVLLPDRASAAANGASEEVAGVGGITGVLAAEKKNGSTGMVKDAQAEGLKVSGVITARLPDPGKSISGDVEADAAKYKYGVGGVAGYANAEKDFRFKDCENAADISGNLFTGGICGHMEDKYNLNNGNNAGKKVSVLNCRNDGLILCTAGYAMEDDRIEGRYFGGLIGFGQSVLVQDSSSASGRSSGFQYDESRRGELLLGQYVGGILGYGMDSRIYQCSTGRNGYVLGSDYVGGIVGGMDKKGLGQSNIIDGGASVTTNASYVIGNSYVGGIIGLNEGRNKIENCVNNGVAAGYERYTGGIVGYNENQAQIIDCASYLADYDNSIYHMITDTWNAKGDCAGGIAGYNNGEILFDASSERLTVKSVSSIVVGRDYVGGIIGFNDTQGDIDAEYTLIGGRIHAYGDGAGGAVGLNASEKLLARDLGVKPQSVEGNLYVGGCIGANVVELTKNTVMDGFTSNNGLGRLRAQAFAGGVAGYQRTYTGAQLGAAYQGELYGYLSADAGRKKNLLPELGRDGVPSTVLPSDNPYELTVTNKKNTASSLTASSNSLLIQSNLFAGGIIGAAEENSRMSIRNCVNTGNLLLADADAGGVNLRSYLLAGGYRDAADEILWNRTAHMMGGVIGVNERAHVIEHCANNGSMAGITGLGGIVGLNAGRVEDCELTGNFGNAALDVIGGIAGYNIGDLNANRCAPRVTITGHSVVGGIAGYNLRGGSLADNGSYSNITASGDLAGGMAGYNAGTVSVQEDNSTVQHSISGRNGEGIGGIAGYNAENALISVSAAGTAQSVTAVGKNVRISGGRYVGGIVGKNAGIFQTAGDQQLVCGAAEVRAYGGYAGGIAGDTTGDISNAVNRSVQVSADTGMAGGIVPENRSGAEIADCRNEGNVSSNSGYAGGITAVNNGTISTSVCEGRSGRINIQSRNVEACGAVAAVNKGSIYASVPGTGVRLTGTGNVFGGITGVNYGRIYGAPSGGTAVPVKAMPELGSQFYNLTVGGAAGRNEAGARIEQIAAEVDFLDFHGYQYLGGVTGENAEGGLVTACSYRGELREAAGAAGNCYGGIAGNNKGTLSGCSIPGIRMKIKGTYTATSTSTAAQKEQMASHAGAVAGKNEESGVIDGCVLTGGADSSLTAESGMLGGVTGYNKGTVRGSGDAAYASRIADAGKIQTIEEMCSLGAKADSGFVRWENGRQIEDLKYSTGNTVSSGRMRMIMSNNGCLGGIAAYNAPTGVVERSASGSWFLNNKSNAIGVGTGGIIGMNESEKDQTYLMNQAFVGRQLGQADKNRFAGGIIGNQNNTTQEGWTLGTSVNYGTVYCYNTHYSGGIFGQWSGTGGTIANCRNYGNLQTTYKADWVGAAGGIVAQLYHAYEKNDYNIISCGNFGNIYGKGEDATGEAIGGSANDSAGILGNVSNYYTLSAAASQTYTIRVIDCVNGSGVKIYSNSMASGIVGFFSCDERQDTGPVATSTANTTLIIERCRNFANVMRGGGYVGGIFGDRRGDAGMSKTRLYDNFAVNPSSDFYSHTPYPVIGRLLDTKKIQSRKNYLFDTSSKSFTDIGLYQDKDTRSGIGKAVTYDTIDDTTKRADGVRVYVLKNLVSGQYVLAEIGFGKEIDPKTATILSATGDIVNKNSGEKLGRVLCTLDEVKYGSVSDVIQPGNPYYSYVRDSWRRLEGPDVTGTKLLAPKAVSAELEDGRLTCTVTPQKRIDDANEDCDPFKYEVKVLKDDVPVLEHVYLYEEKGSITLPKGISGKLSVEVCAVSMYDDVDASDWIKQDVTLTKGVLPSPDIRAELVKSGTSYRYSFTLRNEDDYALYQNWEVNLKFTDGTSLKLNENNSYTSVIAGKDTVQQIAAQAVPLSTANNLTASEVVSVPAYMPAYLDYYPMIALAGTGVNKASVSCEVTGTTLQNLAVAVTLNAKGSNLVHTPPIYRVELVGTWKSGTVTRQNVVFASRDVLIAAQGEASAVFTGLADYMRNASDVKVRVWYAESGLGPVYTWHEMTSEKGANIYELTGVEDGAESWNYAFSTVLDNNNKTGTGTGNTYYNDYAYLSGVQFTWLPAPELLDVADGKGPLLAPKYDENNHLYYSFYWDRDSEQNFTGQNQYEVKLYGIDAGDNRIEINTDGMEIKTPSDAVTGAGMRAYALDADAEDWNYKNIEIQVTRIGDDAANRIGLTSTGVFRVRQRLSKPAQPTVTNSNSDELDYDIRWEGIVPETGCGSYEVYVRPFEADNVTPGKPELLQTVPTDPANGGSYQITQAMDDYAGKRVQVYIIAAAEADSEYYVNSSQGIVYECDILSRLAKPSVTFDKTWTYDRNVPLTMEEYRSSGLTVKVKADDAASIPPGGSTYLLRAYVFDTDVIAQAAIDGEKMEGYVDAYIINTAGKVQAVPMEAVDAQNYKHTMSNLPTAYAGKWIVFQTRISAGNGNVSSLWTTAPNPVQLPYVKLNPAEALSDTADIRIEAAVSVNPDVDAQMREWTSRQTQFAWDSVEHADTYYVNITERPESGIPGTVHRIRIRETQAVKEDETVERPAIAADEWIVTDDGQEMWSTMAVLFPDMQDGYPVSEALGCYQKAVKAYYTDSSGAGYYYDVVLPTMLEAVPKEDGTGYRYVLTLPDTEGLKDETGFALPGTAHRLTQSIDFRTDVLVNEEEDWSRRSTAYVSSDTTWIDLTR